MSDDSRYLDGPRNNCPWGRVDHREMVAPGIFLYRSADHGGYWLSPQRMAELPEWAKDARNFCKANGTGPAGNWFEHDCDYSIVVLAFPLEFRRWWAASKAYSVEQMDKALADALVVLKGSHPRTWEKYEAANQPDLPVFIFHARIETTTRGRIRVKGRDFIEAAKQALADLNEHGEAAFNGGSDSECEGSAIFAIDLQPTKDAAAVELLEDAELTDMEDDKELVARIKYSADVVLGLAEQNAAESAAGEA